jgi:GT2 family glycosyltransferase
VTDLAVSIVSWNVRDLLAGCLRSVQAAAAHADLETVVWVVDNGSRDGSVDMLAAHYPEVHAIASDENLGFGGGQNLALRSMGFDMVPVRGEGPVPGPEGAASGLPRYVLILNPDTLVDEDALAEMVRFMDQAAGAGVCGPRLSYEDGRFQHAAYRFPSLAQTALDFWPINWRLTESRLNGRYARRLYAEGRPFEIDHPLGAAMLFRRATIAQTGGFDLDYHMYVEEIDWCRRVRDARWTVWCVPSAHFVHYEGQSTRQVRPQMIEALWRSRYIYFGKHHSRCFQWFVRRVIRAGMRAKLRRTARDAARGVLSGREARALQEAYRAVAAM